MIAAIIRNGVIPPVFCRHTLQPQVAQEWEDNNN